MDKAAHCLSIIDNHERGSNTDHFKTSTLFGQWTKCENKGNKLIDDEKDCDALHLERDRMIISIDVEIKYDKVKKMIPFLFRVIGVYKKKSNK